MEIQTYPLGPISANCYLIIEDNEALMIDPGGSSRKIASYLKENNIDLKAILLTHGHFDHISGVDFFANKFNCDVYISAEDLNCLSDPKFNLSRNTIVNTKSHIYDKYNKIGNFEFEAILASGHTIGSIMLLFDDILFSGDVLFKNSIGRCDLIGGSNNQMIQSLNKIKLMNPNIKVFPGHGEATTINEELISNPYLK